MAIRFIAWLGLRRRRDRNMGCNHFSQIELLAGVVDVDADQGPISIIIQDGFELEGTKIFLHFTLIFGVTLEVVIPGDDMWGWRSVSPPWVTREWVIPKALPFKLKPVTCVLFCDRRIQPSERGCRDP